MRTYWTLNEILLSIKFKINNNNKNCKQNLMIFGDKIIMKNLFFNYLTQ